MTKYLIEKGTNYSYLLDNLKNPSFEGIRKLSVNFINQLPEEVQTELWEALSNGVEVLESEALLSMYMYAYGKMHAAKLQAAFEHLPTDKLEDIHLIDWGCGQAMATVVYYEYLKEKAISSNVKTITLIEPSELALKRAALHARKLFPNAEIKTVKKVFDKLTADDIQIADNQTILHLFSNVLDIEYFSIEQLAELIEQNNSYNLLVCVSPYINDFKNQRLINFISCFQCASTIADYVNQEWQCGWTIDYKVVEVNLADMPDNYNSEIDYSETVTDIDGNVYKTVKIGNQIWMAENLRVSRYRNGDIIPNVTDNNEWSKLNTGAWCNYNNNPDYDLEYGKLYNWYTTFDKRGLPPKGWHIPTYDDWILLIKFLGGDFSAGGKLKEVGLKHWNSPNKGATNISRFCALPGGYRIQLSGEFFRLKESGYWICYTEDGTSAMQARSIHYDSSSLPLNTSASKSNGISIRCVKDDLDNSFAIVWKHGLCGFRKSTGEMITPFKYDDANNFIDGLACVKLSSKWGLINKHGKEITEIKYSEIITFCEEFACVSINGKYGFLDRYGKEVIPFDYQNAYSFHEGMAMVRLNDKYGFINKLGKLIIPIMYDRVYSFSEGFAIVEVNEKYGYINKLNKLIIPIIYDRAYEFSEGLAAVKLSGKWGFIDINGNEIIPINYDSCLPFSCGLASVKVNNKWGYIDKTGKVIMDFIFYNANMFENDIAVVCVNNVWKIIDKNGNDAFQLKREYQWIERFKDGLAQVKFEGKYGFIDLNGNEVVPVIYDSAHYFDDCFRVSLNKLDCLLDKKGSQLISFKYSFIHLLIEGVRKVGLNSKYGFIDDKYQESIPIIYDDTHTFNEGLCGVKFEDKWGYIDKRNEIVIPFIYDYAGDFYCGHAKIEINNKSAFINKRGIVVTPFEDVDNSWHP